jgi:CTP:molybdopterin cytidylyltransferase MocA
MVAAVVLAAGAATRYGGPKQQRFLQPVLWALGDAGIEDVVVVEGAYQLEARSARLVECERWAEGPGASLRCGLAALDADVTHALVVLADGPSLDARAVRRVARSCTDADVVAATYDGTTRSHPVALAREVWLDVPDEGARALDPVLVPCDDLGAPGDVDYPEDLP